MVDATAGACQLVIDANGGRASGCQANDPQTIHKVAQEFEALLLSQFLKAAKLDLTGSGGEGDAMTQYAQEALARQLASQGGLGLVPVIEAGLTQTKGEAPANVREIVHPGN